MVTVPTVPTPIALPLCYAVLCSITLCYVLFSTTDVLEAGMPKGDSVCRGQLKLVQGDHVGVTCDNQIRKYILSWPSKAVMCDNNHVHVTCDNQIKKYVPNWCKKIT